MKPSTELKYANLPLCFLAYSDDWQTRLDHAISYGVVETALNTGYIDNMPDDIPSYYETVEAMQRLPKGFDEDDDEHVRIVFAAHRLGVVPGDMAGIRGRHARLAAFVASYEGRHGKDARTKVHFSLLFQMRDKPNEGLSYDEFRVFCAINSTIGGKMPVSKSSQVQIRMRALGYKSRKAFEAECSPDFPRGDGATLLQNYQISRITDRLERKGFFRKLSIPRATFYAQPHLQDEAFHEIVYARQTRRAVTKQQKQQGAEDLATRIRETKQAAKTQREYRKVQRELPFDGQQQNGTPAFHRIDELRARMEPDELATLLRTPNAQVFGTTDGQVVAFSSLPVYKLQTLYAQHRKVQRDGEAGDGEPTDDLPF